MRTYLLRWFFERGWWHHQSSPPKQMTLLPVSIGNLVKFAALARHIKARVAPPTYLHGVRQMREGSEDTMRTVPHGRGL